MKKKLTLLTLFFAMNLFIAPVVKAGTPIVRILEGEVRMGLSAPIGGYHGGEAQTTISMGLEGRYNFKGTPWDCGLMLELTSARRAYEHVLSDRVSYLWQNNRTLAFALTGDYNFRQGKKINPFVGTALGVASNDIVGDSYLPTEGTSMIVAPRVGVEFLHHIRLMAQLNVCRKGYNNFSLTVGIVLGGRPKKSCRALVRSFPTACSQKIAAD